MDDGDILGPREKPVAKLEDLHRTDCSISNPCLVGHCGGTLDLNDLESDGARDRYFLATRTVLPQEITREKLENATGFPATEETVVVLTALAKSFIAKKIETVVITRRQQQDSRPITVSDLLEENFKNFEELEGFV